MRDVFALNDPILKQAYLKTLEEKGKLVTKDFACLDGLHHFDLVRFSVIE